MPRECNARERRFVEDYLIHLSPRRAALAAGYSPATARCDAYRWVANAKAKPHVFHAIVEAQAARSRRRAITADMVLTELARIGFADIRKLVAWRTPPATEEEDSGGGRAKRAPAQILT